VRAKKSIPSGTICDASFRGVDGRGKSRGRSRVRGKIRDKKKEGGSRQKERKRTPVLGRIRMEANPAGANGGRGAQTLFLSQKTELLLKKSEEGGEGRRGGKCEPADFQRKRNPGGKESEGN